MRMEYIRRKNSEYLIFANSVMTKYGKVFVQIKSLGLHNQVFKLGGDPSEHRLGKMTSVRLMRRLIRSKIEQRALEENKQMVLA